MLQLASAGVPVMTKTAEDARRFAALARKAVGETRARTSRAHGAAPLEVAVLLLAEAVEALASECDSLRRAANDRARE